MHVYLRVAGKFFQVTKNYKGFCQTVGGVFSLFLPKMKDVKPSWQIVEDALRERERE
jgi:hypothetical protein